MKFGVLLAAVVLCGCGGMGTGTGNPMWPSRGDGGNSGAVPELVSTSVFRAICSKVASCLPADRTECLMALDRLNDAGPKLGLSLAPPPSGRVIQDMEYAGTIRANGAAGAECGRLVNVLSCADSRVLAAFDPTAPEPFKAVAGTLSPICVGVFGGSF